MDQRNENRGRDQNIFNQPGTVVIHQADQPSRSRVEQQLLQIVRQEVESRLRQSLHNAVLINLGKEAQPEQVKRPWDAEIKIGTRPAEPIPENTSILEVFDHSEIGGKLLILGNPGSGKTTTLLDLAKALIERAETDMTFPIPVLFNLSSWKDDQQPMPDWLVAELKSKYGVRQEIGKQWLQDRALLPLLDGLDELKPERQEGCVNAINTWLTGEAAPLDVVVCSRREEYNAYAATLQLNGAIGLQALTLPQIQNYLAQVNRSELWELLNRDAELLELVQAPLFLSIVLLAYPQDSLEDWRQLGSTQERLQNLWDRYICRMFERKLLNNPYCRDTEPTQQQSRRWLAWLAQQMQQESQTEFLIEKMQAYWLLDWKYLIYKLVAGLCLGIIGGVIFGVFFGIIFWLSIELIFNSTYKFSDGIILGMIIGLMVGLTSGISLGLAGDLDNIIPVETIYLSTTRNRVRDILLNSPQVWLFYIYSPLFWLLAGPGGLLFWLALWLLFTLLYYLNGEAINNPRVIIEAGSLPNQSIKNSSKNSVSILIASSLLIITIFIALVVINQFADIGKGYVIIPSFFIAVALALFLSYSFLLGGGLACIQHFALRCVLFRSGVSPWNYARFLDYASERLLMQRVGGRYRFIHKLLQDHFAEMSLSPPKSPINGGPVVSN